MANSVDCHQVLVEQFRALGLSERAAEVAARGRDVSLSLRSESEAERSASRPQQGNALRLVARIEDAAADLLRRGIAETTALREASLAAFQAMPDDHSQDWAAAVIGRRWPHLFGAYKPPSTKRAPESSSTIRTGNS